MVTITALTSDLQKILKHLKAVVTGKSKKARKTICEGTITDGKATFALPGGVFSLSCQTEGTAKFTLQFLPFYQFVNTYKSSIIKINIHPNEIQIDNLLIKAKTCFLEDDKILKTVDLPYAYTDLDILLLPFKGHTPEELKFNGINLQIDNILSEHERNEIKRKKLEMELRRKRTGIQKNLFSGFD